MKEWKLNRPKTTATEEDKSDIYAMLDDAAATVENKLITDARAVADKISRMSSLEELKAISYAESKGHDWYIMFLPVNEEALAGFSAFFSPDLVGTLVSIYAPFSRFSNDTQLFESFAADVLKKIKYPQPGEECYRWDYNEVKDLEWTRELYPEGLDETKFEDEFYRWQLTPSARRIVEREGLITVSLDDLETEFFEIQQALLEDLEHLIADYEKEEAAKNKKE